MTLETNSCFEYLGIRIQGGRPALEESKLLVSMMIPELYSVNHTHNQLQCARACGLSFQNRQTYPKFTKLAELMYQRLVDSDEPWDLPTLRPFHA